MDSPHSDSRRNNFVVIQDRIFFSYNCCKRLNYLTIYEHNSDVIMSAMASQITGLSIICSTSSSGTDERKLQSSAMMTSLNGNIFHVTALVCGKFTGHRWIPRTKGSDAKLWCSSICVWINGWVNNRDTGDYRRHRAHYDVPVIASLPFVSAIHRWPSQRASNS